MNFNYSRYNITGKEKSLERLFEILPGALSWTIIIGMSVFSFFNPIMASVVMIAFILYWVLRLFYMNIFLVVSYMRLFIEAKTDWMKMIEGIDNLEEYSRILYRQKNIYGLRQRLSFIIHRRQIKFLKQSNLIPPKSKDIYHLVIIPVIKEGRSVVEPGIKSILNGRFPAKRALVLIALEEAAPDNIKTDMRLIEEAYRKEFLDLKVIVHPKDLPGEARVKGANATFAAKKAAEFFARQNIPFENVILSCFDADTVASFDYLGCLTYHYMITPYRNRTSYQPIPVFHNNIWEAPSFARILDIGTSFFQLIESTNPKKLVTFSSHSMSFKALVEVGYWPPDMISDDSAIFWKAFIHYDGNYRVRPMYTTVSMDIASGKNYRQTISNIYKQKRRWAWGVENLPIVMRAFLKPSKILFSKKLICGFKLFDAFISWATWAFLLAFISWLPAVFASREFSTSTVYYMAPRIRSIIFCLSSIGILICMVLSLCLLPKARKKQDIFKKVMHVFEWIFIPVFVLTLSAIPALDAQTRLMFGRYMEFWVSDKQKKSIQK